MKRKDFDWLTDEFMLYCRSTQLSRDTPPGVSVSVSIAYQKKREKGRFARQITIYPRTGVLFCPCRILPAERVQKGVVKAGKMR